MSVANSVFIKAQTMAADAGMQFDPRYSYWVAARGKFEGEPWYAPYYWNCLLEGDGESLLHEECDATADLFQVDGDESEAFDIECGRWILIRCDSQGFVMVTDHESREAAEKAAQAWFA